MNQTTAIPIEPSIIITTIFLVAFFAIFTAFITYLIGDTIRMGVTLYERKKARQRFIKAAITLLDINFNSRDVISLYGRNFHINEIDPDFFTGLIKNLEELKLVIIERDKNYFPEEIGDIKIAEWLKKINEIIDQIKEDHPFAGLHEDELILFEHLNDIIKREQMDLAKSKIIELSRILKTKNNEIDDAKKEAKQSKRISIVSVFIGILGIVVAILLWIFK